MVLASAERLGEFAMDGFIGTLGMLGLLLVAGLVIGLVDRRRFFARWLLVAAGLVLINDILLTNAYGMIPHLLEGARWNWQGKALALVATLAIASLPGFGWKRSGLTLRQAKGSLRPSLMVAVGYIAFFVVIGLMFPNEPASAETIAFQLTMPSLEEESFFRGLLLLALYEAFAGRWRFLGVDWSWGAVLSCALFGLVHAFGYSDGTFHFDPLIMALTALPSFVAVWLRLRTGSLLIPAILHSAGNTIPLFV
jgi:uncharacterized protein